MPNYAKVVLSILVVIVAVLVHRFLGQAGREIDKWLVLGLAAFMILAVWLFPETGRSARKDGR